MATHTTGKKLYWFSVFIHFFVCVLAAWFVYRAVPYFIYPEYSSFATVAYGNQGGPDLASVLRYYNPFSEGTWYRPTTMLLVPYLVQSDLFNPRTIVASNISIFSITAFLVPALFLSGAALPTRIFSSLFLFCAPALMDSYIFPCPDALYILFSTLFLYCLRLAYEQKDRIGGPAVWCAATAFLLAITSKEIAVLSAFVAPFLLLLSRPVRWRRIFQLCAPFMGLAVVFYLFMLFFRLGAGSDTVSYSSVPTLERLSHVGNLAVLVSNLKISRPGSYPGWATSGYLWSSSVVWALIWMGSVLAFVRTFRFWGWQKILPAAAIVLLLLLAIGMLGGQPHHAFAILAVLAVFIPLMWEVSAGQTEPRWLPFIKPFSAHALLLGGLCIGLVLTQARTTDNLLTHGRLADCYRYNTRLFQDERFHELAVREDVYFIVEECPDAWATGGYAGVRSYLGRARRTGDEEYVKKWDPAMLPELASRLSDKEIWLVECRLQEPESFTLRRMWPEQ